MTLPRKQMLPGFFCPKFDRTQGFVLQFLYDKETEGEHMGEAKTIFELDRFLGRIRRTAFFAASGCCFLLASLLRATEGLQPVPLWQALCAVFAILAVLSVKSVQKKIPPAVTLYEDAAAYAAYLKQSWRFYRSLPFYLTMALLGALLSLLDSRPSVLLSFWLAVLLYYAFRWIGLKRLDFVRVTLVPRNGEVSPKSRYSRTRELRHAILLLVLFWLPILGIYLAASLLFRDFLMFLFLPILGGLIFVPFCLISNPLSPYAAVRRKRPLVRVLRAVVMLAVAFVLGTFLTVGFFSLGAEIQRLTPVNTENLPISYDEATGVYTIVRPKDRDLRILQLTDVHLSCGIFTAAQDKNAVLACQKLIEKTKPDLVIVTGDLSYPIGPLTLNLNNQLPITTFALMMDQLNVPWAFVYGNHDTEKTAIASSGELNQMLCRQYANRKPGDGRQLLMANVQPDIYGRYNQYIRIENEAGEPERLLFLMDSNAYTSQGYDSIHEDQVRWYEAVSETWPVPSFLFLHIPFREYRDAAQAIDAGDPGAEYLFGLNREPVHTPAVPSRIFDALVSRGTTQAVFCGHDHLNTLGVRYRGIDLVYGMSIDYIAYPGIQQSHDQRGATLILCSGDSYEIRQIPLS